jgi:hypothetical protein
MAILNFAYPLKMKTPPGLGNLGGAADAFGLDYWAVIRLVVVSVGGVIRYYERANS